MSVIKTNNLEHSFKLSQPLYFIGEEVAGVRELTVGKTQKLLLTVNPLKTVNYVDFWFEPVEEAETIINALGIQYSESSSYRAISFKTKKGKKKEKVQAILWSFETQLLKIQLERKEISPLLITTLIHTLAVNKIITSCTSVLTEQELCLLSL